MKLGGRLGVVKVVEEDLTLFRDLSKRGKDKHRNAANLLLCPLSEEFDHPAQFYRISSTKKLGSAATDFLAGSEKHDYDWLKTPPATPLFPSIEMEANSPQLLCTQKEIPILQPLSRFAGENQANRRVKSPNNRLNAKAKPCSGGSTAPPPERYNSGNHHLAAASKTKPAGGKGRAASPLVRSKPSGFSSETPPNLRTERRSSSVSRPGHRLQSCSHSLGSGRKAEPIAQVRVQARTQENNDVYLIRNTNNVIGSKMVEKVMNARKSTAMLPKNTLLKPRSAAK